MTGNVLCLVTVDRQVPKCPPLPDGRNFDRNKRFVTWYFTVRLCDTFDDILFYFFPFFSFNFNNFLIFWFSLLFFF